MERQPIIVRRPRRVRPLDSRGNYARTLNVYTPDGTRIGLAFVVQEETEVEAVRGFASQNRLGGFRLADLRVAS